MEHTALNGMGHLHEILLLRVQENLQKRRQKEYEAGVIEDTRRARPFELTKQGSYKLIEREEGKTGPTLPDPLCLYYSF